MGKNQTSRLALITIQRVLSDCTRYVLSTRESSLRRWATWKYRGTYHQHKRYTSGSLLWRSSICSPTNRPMAISIASQIAFWLHIWYSFSTRPIHERNMGLSPTAQQYSSTSFRSGRRLSPAEYLDPSAPSAQGWMACVFLYTRWISPSRQRKYAPRSTGAAA